MKKAILFLLFSILFPLHENKVTLQNEVLCEEVDLKKFIEFPYDHMKCLQVAFETDNEVNCILKQLRLNFILLKLSSFTTLTNRDISSEAQDNCQTFLIFAESIIDIKEIFFKSDQDSENHKKQFFPFSKIYIYIFGNVYDSETIDWFRTFLIKNALFGYIIEVANEKVQLRYLLTNDSKRSTSSYTPSDLFHPLVDTRLAKDNFRISLFNCKPFTFYQQNASYKTIINEIDGTEFRFVNEVTKNWKKTFNLRDFSRTNLSPYVTMMSDLSNRSSDLAMCSIWLSEKYYKYFDLTSFYDESCSTYLVPKPKKLNEAISIYTALNTSVWLIFLCVFLLSSVSFKFMSKIEKRLYHRTTQYMDFSSALMKTISIASSQSVHRLPSNDRASFQILLTRQNRVLNFWNLESIYYNFFNSWILFSVWMDICYITSYTSRLTSPIYERPINNVKELLDHEIYLCGLYVGADTKDEFALSVNEDYRKLSTRSLVYGENNLSRRRLIEERKCGIYVNRFSKNYVTLNSQNEDLGDLLPTFRIMDKCVSTHFTGFAFQKHSPYTKLFNLYIRKYQEHGIIKKWYLDISREESRYKTVFKDHPDPDHHHRISLVNVSGTFLLLCIGLVLSTISFCVEITIPTLMNLM